MEQITGLPGISEERLKEVEARTRIFAAIRVAGVL